MIEAIKSIFTFYYAEQQPKQHPLPPNITRHFVKTPGGDIELLIAEPANFKPRSSKNPPIVFAHGGFGHAAVWVDWMSHLSQTYNARTYSYSIRNHGASYSVPFFQMVWRYSFDDLSGDAEACLNHVASVESIDPILVGHSSGGGMSQYLLANARAKVSGLALVGSIPHYGGLKAYENWFWQDPWFGLRAPFHLYHPRSPLSTINLVKGAFFGPEFPTAKVVEFEQWMPKYESMWWPLQMWGKGWGFTSGSRTWLEPVDILRNISGFPTNNSKIQDKICVMMGTHDTLLRGSEGRAVSEYKEAIGKIFGKDEKATESKGEVMDAYVTEYKGNGSGVRYVEVKNAGHHTQNDLQWKEAAEALRRFAEQV